MKKETYSVGQKIKIGEYYAVIAKVENCGYYLDVCSYFNYSIIKQYTTIEDIVHKFNLSKTTTNFPWCESLEKLTSVIEYLKSFEKPVIEKWDYNYPDKESLIGKRVQFQEKFPIERLIGKYDTILENSSEEIITLKGYGLCSRFRFEDKQLIIIEDDEPTSPEVLGDKLVADLNSVPVSQNLNLLSPINIKRRRII